MARQSSPSFQRVKGVPEQNSPFECTKYDGRLQDVTAIFHLRASSKVKVKVEFFVNDNAVVIKDRKRNEASKPQECSETVQTDRQELGRCSGAETRSEGKNHDDQDGPDCVEYHEAIARELEGSSGNCDGDPTISFLTLAVIDAMLRGEQRSQYAVSPRMITAKRN